MGYSFLFSFSLPHSKWGDVYYGVYIIAVDCGAFIELQLSLLVRICVGVCSRPLLYSLVFAFVQRWVAVILFRCKCGLVGVACVRMARNDPEKRKGLHIHKCGGRGEHICMIEEMGKNEKYNCYFSFFPFFPILFFLSWVMLCVIVSSIFRFLKSFSLDVLLFTIWAREDGAYCTAKVKYGLLIHSYTHSLMPSQHFPWVQLRCFTPKRATDFGGGACATLPQWAWFKPHSKIRPTVFFLLGSLWWIIHASLLTFWSWFLNFFFSFLFSSAGASAQLNIALIYG